MSLAVPPTAPPDDDDPAAVAALALARQLLDDGLALPVLPAAGRLALGWALKAQCYAAWSSQPQQAGRAAALLRQLRDQPAVPPLDADLATALAALADWTDAIARITEGRMDLAVQRLDEAAAGFVRLGLRGPAAQTQVPKVMALTLLGQHGRAAACGEHTQREFMQLGDRRSAAKVSLNLGSLQLRRDAYRLAIGHYRDAAVLFARAGDVEHSVMADIGLGDALAAVGDLDEARRIHARARMRATTHALPVLAALADESLALLDLARGRWADALQGLERARRSYEQLAMPQHLAIAEKQLGDAYLELRLLPEALALLDGALARMQALDMPDDLAWALAQHGRALALLGRPGEARASLQRAAGQFAARDNRVGGAAVALVQSGLALAGGDAAQALALADVAAVAYREEGQAEGQVRAEAAAAEALLLAGDAPAAQARLLHTLARADALQLGLVQVQCHTGLGLLARAAGQPAQAAAAFDRAITLFDEQRRALPCDELRSAFLADHLRPYLGLLRLALDAADAAADGTEVLRCLDRFRARALGERLLQGAAPVSDDATQALRTRLNWLYRRQRKLEDEGEPSAALADELRQTERALLERNRRGRLLDSGATAAVDAAADAATDALAAPAPDAVADGGDALCIASLQAGLGPADALVEYGVLDDELFACVVTRGQVRLQRRLAHWPAVRDAVQALRFQIDALRHGVAPLAAHLPQLQRRAEAHLRRLHGWVWAPLDDALAGCGRVLVVPHEQLGALPFTALHDGVAPLGERLELAVAASARIALRSLPAWAGAPRRVLALGDDRRLVHAEAEATAVAALFAQGEAAIGGRATLQTLRERAGQADVLHLACHAEFRHDNPMFSALQLADGPLTAEQAEGLRLPAGIVVLSACETGLAGEHRGDELVGLVRAFTIAGASRVLASLWPVDDGVTAAFMAGFYRALGAGQAPAAALRQAQQAVRQTHPHPFSWAAFALHGGW